MWPRRMPNLPPPLIRIFGTLPQSDRLVEYGKGHHSPPTSCGRACVIHRGASTYGLVASNRMARCGRRPRIAEFASERLAQSIDNVIRIDTATGADHIDQRVTVHHGTRIHQFASGADHAAFRVMSS